MAKPDSVSSGSPAGIGTVFIIGVLSLFLGVLLMIFWNLKSPAFPRRDAAARTRPPNRSAVNADPAEVVKRILGARRRCGVLAVGLGGRGVDVGAGIPVPGQTSGR